MDPSKCERWWGEKHTWGKWEIFEKGEILRTRDKLVVGHYVFQKRSCTVCGHTHINSERVYV